MDKGISTGRFISTFIVGITAFPCLCDAQGQVAKEPNAVAAGGVSTYLVALKVTDKTFDLSYDIRNDSAKDVWICTYRPDPCDWPKDWPNAEPNRMLLELPSCAGRGATDPEVLLGDDWRKKTLVIRRRVAVPLEINADVESSMMASRTVFAFKRLRPGAVRHESLSIALPAFPHQLLWPFYIPPP